jgi:hypothetical protein
VIPAKLIRSRTIRNIVSTISTMPGMLRMQIFFCGSRPTEEAKVTTLPRALMLSQFHVWRVGRMLMFPHLMGGKNAYIPVSGGSGECSHSHFWREGRLLTFPLMGAGRILTLTLLGEERMLTFHNFCSSNTIICYGIKLTK